MVPPGINDLEDASNNLWVGNLAPDATDSDLMNVFAKYGALDSITTYSSRSYAFVFFKRAEDAAAAKDSLQGTVVRGSPLKIEFARPARPSRNLWVGGISPSVTKEQLEEEFLKFGEILEFKFLRERNTAYIEFRKPEDATQAMREMNGKRIDGEQIRVDFLRSLPSRRDQPQDFLDGPAAHTGRTQQTFGGRKEGPPSKVLWIGFPPSVQIDDQMLHNAMILFGEIERISSYPARHFSFVEFRSIDEARRAKEGLQGRLFNDPRITIMFSNSELAPGKGYSGFHPALKNARGGMYNSRSGEREIFDHHHPMGLNNFPGQLPPGSINRSNLPMRPFGPQSNVDSVHPGPEFTDLASGHAFQDRNTNLSPDPSWKRQSPPTSGLLPSPASGFRPPLRPGPHGWDVLELDQLQREPKRSRIEAPLSSDGVPGPYSNIQADNSISPHGAFGSIGRQAQDQLDQDYIWRGIIAKGGQPVCRARCVPIGKGIDAKITEVVNCSARTGLDLLAQHYAEAVGYDIIFFLPDDEDDFEPYTEFLRYLSSKNRAGVAKLEDGTTLFLVPPSDFLTDVLKFEGPPRLYGVVLKRTQQMPSVASVQPPLHHLSHGPHVGRLLVPSAEADANFIPHKDDYVIPAQHDRVLHENLNVPPKSLYPLENQSTAFSSVASPSLYPSTSNTISVTTNSVAASQSGVSLTPELIATLATLLPVKAQSSALQMAPPASGSSFPQPSLSSAITDGGSQVWKHGDQVSGALNPLQSGNQFNARADIQNQFQPYPSVPNIPSQSEYMTTSAQVQHSNMSMPYQATIPSMPLTSLPVPSPSGQPYLSSAVSQQELPHGTYRDYRIAHEAALPGAYNPSAIQQSNHPSALSNQVPTPNYTHAQPEIPASADCVNYMPQNHGQQSQTSLQGGQSAAESEVDKNQRYQSTLQFAANLLQQIQQKQQQQPQTSNPSARGSGNPQ